MHGRHCRIIDGRELYLPEEWSSGDIVGVIEVVARKDAIKPLLPEFSSFQGKWGCQSSNRRSA